MSELELLESAITAHYGLIPRSAWAEELGRGLNHLARRARVSISRLVEQLISDRHRLRELCGWLTVGESYFFRDEQDFSHLSSRIGQLQKLCERLGSEPSDILLEDGATSSGELLAAAESLRRSLE